MSVVETRTGKTSNIRRKKFMKAKPADKHTKRLIKQELDKRDAEEIERKFRDVPVTSAVPVGGTLTQLTGGILTGTGPSSRIGLEILAKSVFFRMVSAHDDSTNFLRHVIFRWHDSSTPTLATVFASPIVYPITSPYNVDSMNKISILYDNTYAMSQNAAPIIVEKYFIARNMKVKWTLAGAAETGHIYSFLVSDSVVSGPTTTIYYRTRYTDA